MPSKDILHPTGECPECDSPELRWHAGTKNIGGVQDGRIRMSEVVPIFFLGCEFCGETIKVIEGDEVAEFLNSLQDEKFG